MVPEKALVRFYKQIYFDTESIVDLFEAYFAFVIILICASLTIVFLLLTLQYFNIL